MAEWYLRYRILARWLGHSKSSLVAVCKDLDSSTEDKLEFFRRLFAQNHIEATVDPTGDNASRKHQGEQHLEIAWALKK